MQQPVLHIRSVAGFTIAELMIVVVIVGILTAVAAPSFTEAIEKQRARSSASDLHAALTRARSEAIKRNADITLAPISSTWTSGWRITDSNSIVIDEHGSIGSLTISGPASVVYRSSGRISGTVANFSITGTHASATRCVYLDLSGRPSAKAEACGP